MDREESALGSAWLVSEVRERWAKGVGAEVEMRSW